MFSIRPFTILLLTRGSRLPPRDTGPESLDPIDIVDSVWLFLG